MVVVVREYDNPTPGPVLTDSIHTPLVGSLAKLTPSDAKPIPAFMVNGQGNLGAEGTLNYSAAVVSNGPPH